MGSLGAKRRSASDDDPPCVVRLRHPSGSQVYLVGVAHVSKQSVNDVISTIARVKPGTIVLELDETRYKKLVDSFEQGDPFKAPLRQGDSLLKAIKLSLTGNVLVFSLSMMYSVLGALLGSPPGAEFYAATLNAKEVGSKVVLGDRHQDVTMKRLVYFAQTLARKEDRARHKQVTAKRSGELIEDEALSPADDGAAPATEPFPSRRQRRGEGRADEEDFDPVTAAVDDDSLEGGKVEARPVPWDAGGAKQKKADAQLAQLQARVEALLLKAGCEHPHDVITSFKRIIAAASRRHATVAPEDVLAVRACGEHVVEEYRERAVRGDRDWAARLRAQTLAAGEDEPAAAQAVQQAMEEVVVHERDVILTRQIWEAGLHSRGRPVVGVVGAGHVPGIKKHWLIADTPRVLQQVEEYCQPPPRDTSISSKVQLGLLGAGAGLLAYRRPRLAATAGALLVLPYYTIKTMVLYRSTKIADRLVTACEAVPSEIA